MRRKGISPVIATVIIVAVAIAIAIAVAFWMTGIIGLFTRFEKVEVSYCYAEWNHGSNQWTVYIKVRNTGSADATITNIFVNGKPYSAWNDITSVKIGSSSPPSQTFDPNTGYALPSGTTAYIEITIGTSNGEFNHGMSVEFKIVTASGQEYPKMTNLP